MTEATLFLPGLSPVGGKEISATFDGGQLSSDGGVLILREIEKRLGIAAMLSARDPSRVIHTHADMIQARVPAAARLESAAPRRSLWRTATFETLRRAFLKIAVRVEGLKSRIKVAFPSAYPHAPVPALAPTH
jgi:hypothetical protein